MMSISRTLPSLLLLAAALFAFLPQPARASAPTGDAGAYVQSLGNQALAVISNTGLGKVQRQAALEKIMSDNVDIPWVGRFVIGRFWRTATDEQKQKYLSEYGRFLVQHYSEHFTEYTGGSFKVTDSKDDGEGEYTVSMQVASSENPGQPVLVDYRVRKEANGGFKIFDVIVEGVSMITTQRSEFTSVINNHDLNYLISQLASNSIYVANPGE